MNSFLKNLEITFRRDPTNYRPRINKKESTKDREQKLAGSYYYLGTCWPLRWLLCLLWLLAGVLPQGAAARRALSALLMALPRPPPRR